MRSNSGLDPLPTQQGQREVVGLWVYFGGGAHRFADRLVGKQEEENSRMSPLLWPEPQKDWVGLN